MPTTTGSLVAASATISVGPESIGLLSRARELLQGVGALAAGPPEATASCQFLAAWTLELTLKAYLSHAGATRKQLEPIRHTLAALWCKSVELGLSFGSAPPRWCELLSVAHNAPYHSRYPTHAAAAVGPGAAVMNAELQALFAVVNSIIQPGEQIDDA
jgi:hypothetical protein